MIINDSLCWGVGIVVGSVCFRCVGGEVKVSRLELVWNLMVFCIESLVEVLVLGFVELFFINYTVVLDIKVFEVVELEVGGKFVSIKISKMK